MKAAPQWRMVAALAFLLVAGGIKTLALFGVGDVSFVTVVANPAEAANWVSQLQTLANQLAKLQQTEAQIEAVRAQAGDPASAVRVGSDLSTVLLQADALIRAPSTGAALASANPGSLEAAFASAGVAASMSVLGQSQSRDPSRYQNLAQLAAELGALRAQIGAEQTGRQAVQEELDEAWGQFRSSSTESEKQAALTRIEQLRSEDAVVAERRRALLDDEAVADRQSRVVAATKAAADDEQWLAQGSAVANLEQGRASAAETQRLNVVNAPASVTPPADYSSVKLWGPSDVSP